MSGVQVQKYQKNFLVVEKKGGNTLMIELWQPIRTHVLRLPKMSPFVFDAFSCNV